MQNSLEQNYLSAVIVVDHKCNDITNFTDSIVSFCKNKFAAFEIIFVDNNAKDVTTKSIANYFSNSGLNSHLIKLPYEVNKEQAALSGLNATIGDFVFEFDTTKMDYGIEDLWRMYQTCLSGNDIVLLKPNCRQSLLVKQFYKYLVKLSGKDITISSSTVHLLSRRAINRINHNNGIIHYRKYAYCNLGLNYSYLEYTPIKKATRKEKITFAKIDFATDLLLLFTNVGKRIALFFNIFFSCSSILAIVYTIFMYVTTSVISGWTTLMLFLSISFTGLFLCLTLIVKYLNLLLVNNQSQENFTGFKTRI